MIGGSEVERKRESENKKKEGEEREEEEDRKEGRCLDGVRNKSKTTYRKHRHLKHS